MTAVNDEVELGEPPVPVTSGRVASRPLPWLGGARGSVLQWCPGERSLYGGLGLGVLLTAVIGGFAATVATSYMLRVPTSQAWPVGLVWGLVIGNLDRLLLLVTANRKRLLAMVPRLVISVFLGFLIAEPLTLRIFQPEINAQMAVMQQQDQAAELHQISATYQPKIAADYQHVAALEQRLAGLKKGISRAQLKAACEAEQTNCSTTHLLGCGPYCRYYQRQAVSLHGQYASVAPGIRSQIAADRTDATSLAGQEAAAQRTVHEAIGASGGWLARKHALDQLERSDPGVRDTVWLVRLAFVLVDLAPLLIKVLLVMFGKSVYEDVAEAASERERVAAHHLAELARLERRKITRRADADDEIDEAVIEVYKEEKIAAVYGETWVPQAGGRGARGPGTRSGADAPRIQALSLADFADGSRVYENMPVPIARPLARLAWIGTAGLGALDVILFIAHSSHLALSGGWLGLAVLPAGLLAVFTRGFRRGPAWAQRAVFAVGLAGLVVPALVLALNLG